MIRALFYDTWAFLALANAADPDHAAAAAGDEWREQGGYVVVTSDYVLDESLTGLHVAAGARVALRFAHLFMARVQAETIMLIEVHGSRRDRALELFRRLAPETPRLSFTDCTSFALMHELDVKLAFTADRHFHRAGRGVRPLFQRRGGRAFWHPPTA